MKTLLFVLCGIFSGFVAGSLVSAAVHATLFLVDLFVSKGIFNGFEPFLFWPFAIAGAVVDAVYCPLYFRQKEKNCNSSYG